MIDKSELKRLAEDIHGPGSTIEMLSRWRKFEHACEPKLIVGLLDENERQAKEIEALRIALTEILENSDDIGARECASDALKGSAVNKGDKP